MDVNYWKFCKMQQVIVKIKFFINLNVKILEHSKNIVKYG